MHRSEDPNYTYLANEFDKRRDSINNYQPMEDTSPLLAAYGIKTADILRNASPACLYEEAMRREPGTSIASSGALIALSGAKTGRSPGDKRVVKNPESQDDIWWSNANIELDETIFQINRERAIDYLNTRDRLYCLDGYAGWDPNYRLKIRVICSRAYHALFMHNMLIRPTELELVDFGEPDYVIYNGGSFPANAHTKGMTSKTSIDINFEEKEIVILGTEYAGEMKKGVFTVMNYLMPKLGHLSMHCSATESKEDGSTSVLFGLSGTGKTTLSADPKRYLLGDDEHVWTNDGIFNIEGGCYAKAINLTLEAEPDIFNAIRFGSVLENVVFSPSAHKVDYFDTSLTQNTRASYPIEYIPNAKIPCMGTHPKDVIFLTCDAFGILPPVSRLNKAQAMYHFISGYTAKVAGTEMGVTEPQATFSACFGSPFLAWHPSKYAELLAKKMDEHDTNVWLVNTGWSGGSYGIGERMQLSFTRAIIDAIHSGELAKTAVSKDPLFGFQIPGECPHVPSDILIPKHTWEDPAAFDETANQLVKLFVENFKTYADGVSDEVRSASPKQLQ